ncbi:MAG: hypothetical protein HQ521_16445 [Bacteroidetes bacterium]|nr:hypothetical protein [Bacteroidota bacterium]
MKKLLLIFITLTMSVMVIAQEKSKQKEVGLVFNSLNSFGLTYKTGTTKSLWRFNTLFISGNSTEEVSDSINRKQSNMGFSIKFGKEYRKLIVDDLEFRYGVDLAFAYSQYTYNTNDRSIADNDNTNEKTSYTPGINLVFGLNYIFNDHFVIGAELLPYFNYTVGKSKITSFRTDDVTESDISGFSYGLNSTSVMLSLVYRF